MDPIISKRIYEAINFSSKSKRQIINEMKISKSRFYSILNGEGHINEKTIIKLCTVLEVSSDWLLGLKESIYGK